MFKWTVCFPHFEDLGLAILMEGKEKNRQKEHEERKHLLGVRWKRTRIKKSLSNHEFFSEDWIRQREWAGTWRVWGRLAAKMPEWKSFLFDVGRSRWKGRGRWWVCWATFPSPIVSSPCGPPSLCPCEQQFKRRACSCMCAHTHTHTQGPPNFRNSEKWTVMQCKEMISLVFMHNMFGRQIGHSFTKRTYCLKQPL